MSTAINSDTKPKNCLRKYIDNCPAFRDENWKRWNLQVIGEWFGLTKHYFWNIYRGADNPGANTRERIVAKLREAGYPELRYEDVWCPAETSNTGSFAST